MIQKNRPKSLDNLFRYRLRLGALVCSFPLVAFGQPAWSPFLSPLAAALGYALFWVSSFSLWEDKKRRFFYASLWFAGVQMVQLSWMTSIEFQGYYILAVYIALSLWLGAQFGGLSLLLSREVSFFRALVIAALWTVIEWSRLFFLCGFSWNPVGLALTGFLPSLQWAALGGIYGLSFWVILVNVLAVHAFLSTGRQRIHRGGIWFVLALLPTLYGMAYLKYAEKDNPLPHRSVSLALVQTGLLPSEKVPLPGKYAAFISPYEQWKKIIHSLHTERGNPWDLIVLPEAVVPMPAYVSFYNHSAVVDCLKQELGEDVVHKLPPLQPPFAEKRWAQGEEIWCVSNAFWAQALSNIYHAEVVVGLDHHETVVKRHYNAAFHFLPFTQEVNRYDKRVLLPLGEYLPFQSLKFLTKRYGISEFFSAGTEARVLGNHVPFSVSICYEETFSDLIREGRLKGAELFINVTNDNYYPDSRLSQQHFDLARLRAVENGIPLVRACNTGVTAAVDGYGRVLSRLGSSARESERLRGVLTLSLPLASHSTLYHFFGDGGIIGLCSSILLIFFRLRRTLRVN